MLVNQFDFIPIQFYWYLGLLFFFRVVFNDIVQTNKDYMRDISVIEPDWLCELAPHFYQFGTVSSYI